MMQPGESNTSSEMCISFTLSIKRFGKIFNVFKITLFCSPRLHLFD